MTMSQTSISRWTRPASWVSGQLVPVLLISIQSSPFPGWSPPPLTWSPWPQAHPISSLRGLCDTSITLQESPFQGEHLFAKATSRPHEQLAAGCRRWMNDASPAFRRMADDRNGISCDGCHRERKFHVSASSSRDQREKIGPSCTLKSLWSMSMPRRWSMAWRSTACNQSSFKSNGRSITVHSWPGDLLLSAYLG